MVLVWFGLVWFGLVWLDILLEYFILPFVMHATRGFTLRRVIKLGKDLELNMKTFGFRLLHTDMGM